ncbi:Rne/Rng family ribonuclease [bacterium]|nr:Rne/Rng family ribonuclease [bacterium]
MQTSEHGAEIALLRDGKLMEIHRENYGGAFQVGDIYFGKIKKIMPGLRAAFVDIGHPKDAFLHYHDLGPDVPSLLKFIDEMRHKRIHTHLLAPFNFVPPIHKDGKIEDVFKVGDQILVQIVKEPISTKGPRLTSAISLPGRYVILIPFADNVSVSKKIESREERIRLKDLIKSIKPKGFGVIVRTASDHRTVNELDQDLRELLQKWKEIYQNIKQHKKILYREPQKVELLLRDMFNDSFEKITVDNKELHHELREYISTIAPQKKDIVRLYEPKTHVPLFSELNINRQLQSLFGKIVNIGGGAYLVIEHTEAMHVIDVNSGSKRLKDSNQEETALKTNLEAAAEIARQLRLRDMGGIIVIDFIDMRNADNKKKLLHAMKDQMADDRAKHTILPPSRFGLIQITRQRVRPENKDDDKPVCPLCKGTGNAPPTPTVVEQLESRLREIGPSQQGKITLHVHPYLEAFLTKGFPSKRLKWAWQYKKPIAISSHEEFAITHFEFL